MTTMLLLEKRYKRRSLLLKLLLLLLLLIAVVVVFTQLVSSSLLSSIRGSGGSSSSSTSSSNHRYKAQQIRDVDDDDDNSIGMRKLEEDTLTTTTTTANDSSYYYYYETSFVRDELADNITVTIGNPMKGLFANVANKRSEWSDTLPSSLHFIKRGLDDVLIANPEMVNQQAYNWTILELLLQEAELYRSHAIIRFFIHWPSKDKDNNNNQQSKSLYLPNYLNPLVFKLNHDGEIMPWYGDINLRKAIKAFIYEFGKKYDGDKRIFAIQAGLLGAYGEWHSQGCTYRGEDCCPQYVEDEVIQWYGNAFTKTHIQFRRPERIEAYRFKFGFHDDSFTYITVGGEPNGGYDKNSIFMTAAIKAGTSDFWKWAPMGGEIHPENMDDVFTPNYRAGTQYHQDFFLCTNVTHATYIAWSRGFVKGGVTGIELQNAIYASSQMGYNFRIDKVSVYYPSSSSSSSSSDSSSTVDVDVIIRQIGIAPFYYPLWLNLFCGDESSSSNVTSSVKIPIGDLAETGSTIVSTLQGIPATSSCLNQIELQLGSSYLYPDRPIKWAQGLDGRVRISIPLPPPNSVVSGLTTSPSSSSSSSSSLATSTLPPSSSSPTVQQPPTTDFPLVSPSPNVFAITPPLSSSSPSSTITNIVSSKPCNCTWLFFWRCLFTCAF